jgi:acyl-coenzyme A synthetase/AMP-(fatty) acid ligase
MSESLLELWTGIARSAPSAVAVADRESRRDWTRADLDRAAAEMAGSLPRGRAGRAMAGRRVAMAVPNGAEWFQVFLALLGAGASPVPVDPSEPEGAQRGLAASAGASHLWSAGALHSLGTPLRRAPPGECLVKLTSGSSGAPKALSVTHAQLTADGRQICESMGIGPADANLAAIPLGYSYGLGNVVAPLLIQGSRAVCIAGALPHGVAAAVRESGATVFPAVPPMLRALVDSDVAASALAGMRLVISAGSPLSPELARAFAGKFGILVHGFYGTSETGGIAYDRTGAATLEGRSVGTPLSGVTVRAAASGRVRVASRAVAGRGSFSPADRAAVSDAGELVLLGRTDRMVKIAGRRVDLGEVEAALRSVPGVRDAFACMDAPAGAPLGAAVATDRAAAEIRRALRERIAPWKVPERIAVLAEFPVTARGKTDAARLRQLLAAPRSATSTSTLSASRQTSARR